MGSACLHRPAPLEIDHKSRTLWSYLGPRHVLAMAKAVSHLCIQVFALSYLLWTTDIMSCIRLSCSPSGSFHIETRPGLPPLHLPIPCSSPGFHQPSQALTVPIGSPVSLWLQPLPALCTCKAVCTQLHVASHVCVLPCGLQVPPWHTALSPTPAPTSVLHTGTRQG